MKKPLLFVLALSLACSDGGTDPEADQPAALVVVGGVGQSGVVGQELGEALAVQVTTVNGNGVADVTVQFDASSDGAVQPKLATTDATGTALTTWTLRTTAGADTVIATVSSLPDQPAFFTATANPDAAESVTVQPDSIFFFSLGVTSEIEFAAFDQYGNATDSVAIAWTSGDPSVASVDTLGRVTSMSTGITTVRAEISTSTGADEATVIVDQFPETIQVTPSLDTLTWVGDTTRLTVTASDSTGHEISDAEFEWVAEDTTVISVDNEGLVEALASGATEVIVSYRETSDTARIVAIQVPAAVQITSTPDTIEAFGDTLQLEAAVQDSGSTVISEASVTWSSLEPTTVDVTASGEAISQGNGSANILARYEELADTIELTVLQRLADISLSPDSLTISPGMTSHLELLLSDPNGHPIDTTTVPVEGQWSTGNVNWVTVDEGGVVTGRAAGRTEVTFALDTVSRSTAISIVAPMVGPITTWEWLNPKPQGNSLTAGTAAGSGAVYTAGLDGTIVHFDGAGWTSVQRLTPGNFYDIVTSNVGEAIVVGGEFSDLAMNGTALFARGVGADFTLDSIPGEDALQAAWVAPTGNVYAATRTGTILRLDEAEWVEVSSLPGIRVWDMEGDSLSQIVVAGQISGTGTVQLFDGASWSELYSGHNVVQDLWISRDDNIYAVALAGGCSSGGSDVLVYNGVAWDTLAISGSYHLESVHGTATSDVYVVGNDCQGRGLKLHWDGSTWTAINAVQGSHLSDAWSVEGNWFAVGNWGIIETDDGSGWQAITSGLLGGTEYLLRGRDMWVWSPSNVYALTFDSRVLRWDGSALSEVSTPISGTHPISNNRTLNAVWGASPNAVFVGGGSGCVAGGDPSRCDGALMHFDGSTWNVVYDEGVIIDAIWGSASDDVFALGYGAGYHFDGESWTQTGQGVFDDVRVRAVWGSASDDVWACDGQRQVYHYNGNDWSQYGSLEVACSDMFGFASDNIYLVGRADGPSGTINAIARYDGSAWSTVYMGAFPASGFGTSTIWGSGADDVHAVMGDEYVRFDGSTWSQQVLPFVTPLIIRGDGLGQIFGAGNIAALIIGNR